MARWESLAVVMGVGPGQGCASTQKMMRHGPIARRLVISKAFRGLLSGHSAHELGIVHH